MPCVMIGRSAARLMEGVTNPPIPVKAAVDAAAEINRRRVSTLPYRPLTFMHSSVVESYGGRWTLSLTVCRQLCDKQMNPNDALVTKMTRFRRCGFQTNVL